MPPDEPPPRRRRRAPEDTRREILDGAAAFLREHPWGELTIDGVMSRTTLSRPSFYVHFEDRLDLLRQLGADVAGKLAARADRREWLADPDHSFATARAAIDGLVQLAVEDGPLIRALFEASYREAEVSAARTAIEHEFVAASEQWIRTEMDRGRAPAGDAHLLAEGLTLLTLSGLVHWFGGPEPADPTAVADTLMRHWAGAVFGAQPHEVEGW